MNVYVCFVVLDFCHYKLILSIENLSLSYGLDYIQGEQKIGIHWTYFAFNYSFIKSTYV